MIDEAELESTQVHTSFSASRSRLSDATNRLWSAPSDWLPSDCSENAATSRDVELALSSSLRWKRSRSFIRLKSWRLGLRWDAEKVWQERQEGQDMRPDFLR